MRRALIKSALAVGVIVLAGLVLSGGVLVWAMRSESGLRFVWVLSSIRENIRERKTSAPRPGRE